MVDEIDPGLTTLNRGRRGIVWKAAEPASRPRCEKMSLLVDEEARPRVEQQAERERGPSRRRGIAAKISRDEADRKMRRWPLPRHRLRGKLDALGRVRRR